MDRLTVRYRRWYMGSTPFDWRGVTAFRLVELVARGHEPAARAYVVWAAETGFTVVRTLSMEAILFPLTPTQGRAALPMTLQLIQDHGLAVEVVGLSDTASYPGEDLVQHLVQVHEICTRYPGACLEGANEPSHPTHRPGLTSTLRGFLPLPATPVAKALGSVHGATYLSTELFGGDYATTHPDRWGSAEDQLHAITKVSCLAQQSNTLIVVDEPIGAGEADQPGRRVADPNYFRTMGILGRICRVPITFHCEDGLHARVPGPVQRQCAAAFVAGMRG